MGQNNSPVKKEGFGEKAWIIGNRCYRCEHKWVPRDFNEPPEICPSCKSPYWKTPRVRGVKKK
ncbi:hypothetical protein KW805_02175 [Candidatus Pacearchaeota archaeon]|nr:hypothetical protein [Candidatus Pacearchaeota archaeon]